MEINTTKIISDTNSFDNSIKELNKELNNINKALESLKSGWSGKDATDFYNKIEKTYLPELKNAISILSTYTKYLKKIPRAYEIIDDSYANKKIDN